MTTLTDAAANELLAYWDQRLPVDVSNIAKHVGLIIREEALEDEISGMLVLKDSVSVIVVNKLHHVHRQRFTIAHELGHFLLHRNENKVFIDTTPVFFRDTVSSEGQKQQEIDANAVAAALLMPEQTVKDLMNNKVLDAFDDAAIHRLAKRFGVSVQAMTIRLTKLKLI